MLQLRNLQRLDGLERGSWVAARGSDLLEQIQADSALQEAVRVSAFGVLLVQRLHVALEDDASADTHFVLVSRHYMIEL